MRQFFAELKRRNVLRAGVLYIGAVWALAQGLAQLLPLFGNYARNDPRFAAFCRKAGLPTPEEVAAQRAASAAVPVAAATAGQ